jgi:hypothetical protein
MRIWMWAALAGTVAVTNLAATKSATAADPWSSPQFRGNHLAGRNVSPPVTTRTAAWRQEAAAPVPARPPAIAGHGGIGLGSGNGAGVAAGGGVDSAVISQTAWNNEHVYTGYVFGPGSCDYTPPCVDHLWDGYCQRPCRCGHHHGHGLFNHCGRCGGGNGGCSTCGQSYASCDSGGGCHGCRLHGGHHNRGGCGCETSVSTCDSGNSGCGMGHFGKHMRAKCCGWFNNVCSSFDGGMGCGCAAPIGNGGMGGNGAETVPTPAPDAPAVPDDGKSARSGFNRYVPWSLK